jgi:parallel beta-helix repeat protein
MLIYYISYKLIYGGKQRTKYPLIIGVIILLFGMSLTTSYVADEATFLGTIYVDGDNTEGPWDGTQEHPYQHIQDAIDTAIDGDTVFVYRGFYQENVRVDKSIILQGEDKNTTIIDGNFIEDTIWIRTSSIEINGFSIVNSRNDGFSAGIHIVEKKWYYPYDPPQIISNICITNCIFYNNDVGVRLSNVSNIYISNCKIYSNKANSIYLLNGNYVDINKCNIIENGEDLNWAYISGGIDISEPCNNINVSNCKLASNIGSGLTVSSIADNIYIYNNIFENNTDIGISIDGRKNESPRNIIIMKNVVRKNGLGQYFDAGIYLADVHGSVTIENNSVLNNNDHGIYLLRSSDNLFINNIIKCNVVDGFYLYESSNNLIENNFIINNKENGIDLLNSLNNDICDNIIEDNNGGIYLDFSSSYNDICGNTIDDNNDGICLLGSSNSISGNNISNNNDGINLSWSSDNTIIGNIITKNDYGVNLSGSSNNIIKGNNFVENYYYQAYFKYSRHNRWIRNYWDDWDGTGPKFIWGKQRFWGLAVPWFNVDWHPAQEPYNIDV